MRLKCFSGILCGENDGYNIEIESFSTSEIFVLYTSFTHLWDRAITFYDFPGSGVVGHLTYRISLRGPSLFEILIDW
jgi:hypothetical protein